MTEKRFKWEDVYQWKVPAFLEVMNGLHEKNKRLKEENRQLKKENTYLSKELDYYYGRSVITIKKQFMVDDAGSLIDMQTGKYYDYVSEVVDLLNEFSCKNEELKKENYELRDGLDFYKEQNAYLSEQINELKQENASMKGRIINAIIESNQVECNCSTCVCEDYVTEELKKW